jgi:hypothetical protein
MKTIVYEIQVCDGVMDYVHGGGYFITEMYIPDLKLFVNEKAIFIGEDERVNVKDEKGKGAENKREKQLSYEDEKFFKELAEIKENYDEKIKEANIRFEKIIS